jgi:hypothetical protein
MLAGPSHGFPDLAQLHKLTPFCAIAPEYFGKSMQKCREISRQPRGGLPRPVTGDREWLVQMSHAQHTQMSRANPCRCHMPNTRRCHMPTHADVTCQHTQRSHANTRRCHMPNTRRCHMPTHADVTCQHTQMSLPTHADVTMLTWQTTQGCQVQREGSLITWKGIFHQGPFPRASVTRIPGTASMAKRPFSSSPSNSLPIIHDQLSALRLGSMPFESITHYQFPSMLGSMPFGSVQCPLDR